MRRKLLGSDRCFYCSESDLACLELDHPVGQKRDPKFTRPACRNCHRKRDMERDLAKLTKNGLHHTDESAPEELHSYLMLLAKDQEAIADVVESPAASPKLIAAALRSTAASLRRKANSLPPLGFKPTDAPLGGERNHCA